MYPQEVITALESNAAIIVIVVNNGMYGTIRMHQEKRFPGRISATTIQPPGLAEMARSMGAHAEQVNSDAEFPEAFERALRSGKAAVLELRVDPRQITPQMRIAEDAPLA
jgi:acetolactate synthase-1/2/3 large subunit